MSGISLAIAHVMGHSKPGLLTKGVSSDRLAAGAQHPGKKKADEVEG
jgi:hypothetical protein